MKTWTVDEMVREQPCPEYDRKRLEMLWAGRTSLSLMDILRLDIPAEDKIWGACRPGAIESDIRDTWIEQIVTRCVTDHALHCGVSSVERWARRWLSGEDRTEEEARAARDAAWAARKAAWDAVRATEAAWAWAAWAAWEAACSAVWAAEAAQDTEYELQVADLVRLLESRDGD